jgi:hypothetical protein
MAFMPHFATPVAEVLFGVQTPGGKLPYTIYPNNYTQQIDFLDMSLTAGPGRGCVGCVTHLDWDEELIAACRAPLMAAHDRSSLQHLPAPLHESSHCYFTNVLLLVLQLRLGAVASMVCFE